jgi:hypothetical protein
MRHSFTAIPLSLVLAFSLLACGGGGGGLPGTGTSSSGGSSSSGGGSTSCSGDGVSGLYSDNPLMSSFEKKTACVTQSGGMLSGTMTLKTDNCISATSGTIIGTIGSLATSSSDVRKARVTFDVTLSDGTGLKMENGEFHETYFFGSTYDWRFKGTWRYIGGACKGQTDNAELVLSANGPVNG